MKKKILIVGKKSFISFNLVKDLKNIFNINTVSIESFFKLNNKTLSSFDCIINCAISKSYVKKNIKKIMILITKLHVK